MSRRFVSVCSGIEAASVAWNPLGWEAAAFAEIAAFPSAVLAHHYPHVPNLGDFTTDAALDAFHGYAGPVFDRSGVLCGAFLGALGKLGYGFAYRVLDAQYFGVAQRRRRVFVVGCLGGWQAAAAVLFERDCLSGNPAPRRQAGTRVAALSATGVGVGGADDNQAQAGHLVAADGVHTALRARDGSRGVDSDCTDTLIAHTLLAEGIDASEDGAGRGMALVPEPIFFANTAGDTALGMSRPGVPPLTTRHGDPGNVVVPGQAVRRITPREAERLQGYEDDYTLIPGDWRIRKPEDRAETVAYLLASGYTRDEAEALADCSDGPRYHALGNSWPVPVVQWIGERIDVVDAVLAEEAERQAA